MLLVPRPLGTKSCCLWGFLVTVCNCVGLGSGAQSGPGAGGAAAGRAQSSPSGSVVTKATGLSGKALSGPQHSQVPLCLGLPRPALQPPRPGHCAAGPGPGWWAQSWHSPVAGSQASHSPLLCEKLSLAPVSEPG